MASTARTKLPDARGSGGFTYMALLVSMLIIGIMTSVVAQTWKSVSRINKEKELIWIGHQYRDAIRGYYNYRAKAHGGAPGAYYPSELKDLLKDPGRLSNYAYLRKIYIDPMTGKDDWVPIRGGDASGSSGIIGVRSASDKVPLKQDGFDKVDESFKGKTKYSEWEFKFVPGPTPVTK